MIQPCDNQDSGAPNSTDSGGVLEVQVRFGLGNRLSALLSAAVVAEAEGIPLRIVWPNSILDRFPCPFGALFESTPVNRFRVQDSSQPLSNDRPLLDTFHPWMTERVRAGQIVRIDACAELRYAKLGEREYRDRIRKRFSQLVPVKEVKHEIELPGAHYFGIHIRYTDHLPAHIATPRCCYDWLIGFLKEEFPTTPLWICGDTPSFVQRLQRIAPEQIRVSQTVRRLVIPARNSIEDIRHALAELITLSQADLVFGSPFSSFSKFASTLGAANLVPIVVHPFFCLRAIEPILWALQRGHDRSASKKDFFPVFATRWAMRNAVRSFARLLMHPTVQDHSWLPDPSFSAHHLRSELPREYDEASQQKLV